jgi:hypothetical protein
MPRGRISTSAYSCCVQCLNVFVFWGMLQSTLSGKTQDIPSSKFPEYFWILFSALHHPSLLAKMVLPRGCRFIRSGGCLWFDMGAKMVVRAGVASVPIVDPLHHSWLIWASLSGRLPLLRRWRLRLKLTARANCMVFVHVVLLEGSLLKPGNPYCGSTNQ